MTKSSMVDVGRTVDLSHGGPTDARASGESYRRSPELFVPPLYHGGLGA